MKRYHIELGDEKGEFVVMDEGNRPLYYGDFSDCYAFMEKKTFDSIVEDHARREKAGSC